MTETKLETTHSCPKCQHPIAMHGFVTGKCVFPCECRLPKSLDVLHPDFLSIKITSPDYFEDDVKCGYCGREPFTKHESGCRQ